MDLYTYYDNGTWKAFEAESLPVKPDELSQANFIDVCSCDDCEPVREYKHKISELKAKALPVGNPNIIWERNEDPIIEGRPIKGELYLWPGTAEKKTVVDYRNTSYDLEVYHLTLPNMKSETSKKIQDETPQERIEGGEEATSPDHEDKSWLYEQYNLTHDQVRDNEVSLLYAEWNKTKAELQRYELERTEMYNKYNEVMESLKELVPIVEEYIRQINALSVYSEEFAVSKKSKSVVERAKKLIL